MRPKQPKYRAQAAIVTPHSKSSIHLNAVVFVWARFSLFSSNTFTNLPATDYCSPFFFIGLKYGSSWDLFSFRSFRVDKPFFFLEGKLNPALFFMCSSSRGWYSWRRELRHCSLSRRCWFASEAAGRYWRWGSLRCSCRACYCLQLLSACHQCLQHR